MALVHDPGQPSLMAQLDRHRQDYFPTCEDFTLAVARYADLAPELPPSLESFTLMTSEGESQPSPLSLAEFDLL